jgi:hypothetical protein
MRTVTAVLLLLAGVLGISAAAARPSPETDSSANTCHEPPAPPAATGGGPIAREGAGSANARLAPPSPAAPAAPLAATSAAPRTAPPPPVQPSPAVSAVPGPTPGPTLYTMTGQRYGQSNVVAVPTVMVPATAATVAPPQPGGFGPYGVNAQTMLPPLLSPPPVVISDGPSPTIGGGGGFMLPVPGSHPSGTLTNPNAQ